MNGEDIDGGGNKHDSDEDGEEDDNDKNARTGEDGDVNSNKKKILVLGKELEKQKQLSDKEFDEKLEKDRLKQAGVVKVEEVKVHRHKNKIFGSEVFKKLGNEEKKSAWDDDDDEKVDDDKCNHDGGRERDARGSNGDTKVAKAEKHAAKRKKSTKDMTEEERKAYRKLQRKRGY